MYFSAILVSLVFSPGIYPGISPDPPPLDGIFPGIFPVFVRASGCGLFCMFPGMFSVFNWFPRFLGSRR